TRQTGGLAHSSVAVHSVPATILVPLMVNAHSRLLHSVLQVPRVNSSARTVTVFSNPPALQLVQTKFKLEHNGKNSPWRGARQLVHSKCVRQPASTSKTVPCTRVALPTLVNPTYHCMVYGPEPHDRVTSLVSGPPLMV